MQGRLCTSIALHLAILFPAWVQALRQIFDLGTAVLLSFAIQFVAVAVTYALEARNRHSFLK